jgi:hypothetical protein
VLGRLRQKILSRGYTARPCLKKEKEKEKEEKGALSFKFASITGQWFLEISLVCPFCFSSSV